MKVFFITFFSCILFVANVNAVTITQNQSMDFASLLIPTVGFKYVIIPETIGNSTGTGTVISGTTRRGEFTITGDSNSDSFSLDIISISTGTGDITLDTFRGIYDGTVITAFPSGSLPRSSSPKNLYLGAKITYNANVSVGVKEMTFLVQYSFI